MTETFLAAEDLREAVAETTFDRPPALVANAHITGLGVARALAAHDVPVVAVDRTGDGVAPPSAAIDFAGAVTYPLDDLDGFRADVEALADAAGEEFVAFGCMDEWVHAFADATPDGVRLPFAERDVVDRVLDKTSLYALAERLDVPYPETYPLDETDPAEAAEALGFPLVVKPALKREFEEAFGTNVVEVGNREEFREVVDASRDAGVEVMAQEKVDVAVGEDRSLASYVPPSGRGGNGDDGDAGGDAAEGGALALVGNPRVRYPREFGTSTVVERVDAPAVEERALAVLEEAGYHGISESEFVYDRDREEYVLLDINTRPWKWIDLPVSAGANLPMAAYADATDAAYASEGVRDGRWVYLRDYLELLSTDPTFEDVLSRRDWVALLSGGFESDPALTTGVYRASDPGPAAQLLETAFSAGEYYCSC